MDNNHNVYNGFFQHLLDANPNIGQQIGQVLQNLVRGMAHHPPPPPAADQHPPEDDPELADLPPLETVSEEDPQDSTDSPMDATEEALAHHEQSQASFSPTPLHHTQPADSMPSLASVSSPSISDVDMHDVEMTVDPSQPLAAESSTPAEPGPSTIRGARRARVDDEEDEENMRETNRQRMHSPEVHNQELPGAAPQPAHQAPNPHAPGNAPNPPPLFSRIVYSFDIIPPPPPRTDGAQRAGAQTDPHAPAQLPDHLPPPAIPMINLSFNVPITPPGTGAPAGAAGEPAPDGQMLGGNFQVGDPTLVFGGPGDFAAFPFPFGMHREEPDDPDRAKRLVAGLDEVPLGLVRRMERVGGSGTSEGDSPLCAICWERLTDVDAGGFELEPEVTEGFDAASAGEGAGTAGSKVVDAKKIVVLPCSHVFHTSCLFPWFSKPHRTTCPTCRFDIDPDSLTYSPRRRPQRPQTQPQTPLPTDAQPTPTAVGSEGRVRPQPEAQAGAGVPPIPGDGPNAAPRPNQGRPAGQRLPPFIALDFNVFVPVVTNDGVPAPMTVPMPPAPGTTAAGLGAGTLPGFTHLEEEAARGLFERLFGVGPHPAGAGAHGGPQPQLHQPVDTTPAGGAPAGQANLDGGAPDVQGAGPNGPFPTFESMFVGPTPHFFEAFPPAMMHPPVDVPVNIGGRFQRGPRPPKPQWTLPAAPGPTLRQRIERKEHEMGLRCSDVSCGLGPSDEEPLPTGDANALRQLSIHPFGKGMDEKVCEHTFHPSCLVSAERVAGWGGEDKKEGEVEVSCPTCRAVGYISRADWDEGACALV
ncbi:hypothetical protein BKA93DRAFT_318784 [Sparassis latifolia]